MPRRHHLTAQERDKIALWRAKQVSIRKIAQRLHRSHSSIVAELKRNRFGEHYVAIHAQAKAAQRRSLAGRRTPLKDTKTFSYVLSKLKLGWSPEQIAGRLAVETGHTVISHETIYQYIYAEENKHKNLWEYLPRKQKRRRKKYGRKSLRGQIPDRVSIHTRPEEVAGRKVAGHWEGDSVEGKNHKGGIHTQVERKTRVLLAAKIDNLTSEETLKAQRYLFEWLPPHLKKSTTVDNGKEFYQHHSFELPVYFADPYSSFQRGTNENTNGLLRRYFPKKTDFATITQEDINEVVQELNNRPRMCLHFRTPVEEFRKELQLSGRIQP